MSQTKTGADLNPTAEVRADVGKIIVSVGEGYYEVYVDKTIQKSPYNYQTREYTVDPGDHRISVYSAGRMIYDEVMHVPAEGEWPESLPEEPATETPPAAEEPEQPAEHEPEQPAEEHKNPEPYVSIKASIIQDLIDEMRDIAALLEGIIAAQEPQGGE